MEPPGAAERTTALVHFYRGEVTRSNTWRTRLDATTNWAVVTAGAALTFAFGGTGNNPVVLLIVTLLTLLFLFIEARRYRYYELWTYRVRLMETNFFAPLFQAGFQPQEDWTERVRQSLLQPAFPISLLEAFGRRYRRNYAPLFLILAVSWIVKVAIHPVPAATLAEFVERARVGPVPGPAVLGAGVVFNGGLLVLGLFTAGMRETEAEVFGKGPRRLLRLLARLRAATRDVLEVELTAITPLLRNGRKQLVYIISDEVEAISRPLLEKLDRGVTLIRGTGMYSGEEHGILLCVVKRSQVAGLKEIVYQEDPDAFLIITAAQDVRGEGFRPLEA